MIYIKNLYKSFKKHPVLTGLDLEVRKGQILVIVGRSGVGKSILLKLMLGLEKPDNGTIKILGKSITPKYTLVKDMGMVFQKNALFDSMNIFANIAFYLRYHGNKKNHKPYTEEEIKKKVFDALALVGLKGVEKKMPAELSGGMQKRVALARVLVYRPKIILYDEPTEGLDPITKEQINALIVNTQKTIQSTAIVVTHDMYSAMSIADNIALLNQGKIAYIADPKNFIEIQDPIIQSFCHSMCKQRNLHA